MSSSTRWRALALIRSRTGSSFCSRAIASTSRSRGHSASPISSAHRGCSTSTVGRLTKCGWRTRSAGSSRSQHSKAGVSARDEDADEPEPVLGERVNQHERTRGYKTTSLDEARLQIDTVQVVRASALCALDDGLGYSSIALVSLPVHRLVNEKLNRSWTTGW